MSTYVDRSSQETYDSHENDQARLLPDVKDLYRHDEEPKQQEKGVTQARSKQILSPKTFTLQGWICLALVIVTSFSSGFGLGSLLVKRCNEKECTKLLSGYSPALEAVEYIDYQFQGEFSDSNLFKGRPRPELDDAWDRASALHEISMEPKYLPLLNKSETAIRYSKDQGGGYMVELEVFHQIHCLNLLRKQIYRDYYMQPEYKPLMFEVKKKLLYNHIDHCVDVIRQLIMCAGDISPVTANWVVTHHHPHPDFNTVHKCRNFDKLLDWAEKHEHGGVEFRPDSTLLPAPRLSETIWEVETNGSVGA